MKPTARLFSGIIAAFFSIAAGPALVTPHPRSDEWWFSAWGIERDVWPVTKGSGVTVAVIDTGVNASLPELSGVVLKGIDTTGVKGDGRKDFDNEGGGHGTGMAALISGQGGGSTGFVGIAPEAKILPIRSDLGHVRKVDFSEAIPAAIRYSVDHHVKVINISAGQISGNLSEPCEIDTQKAVAYALLHDVVVVAASGNSGDYANLSEYPASCAGVLTVGAIGKDLRPWVGTQRKNYVSVAAPGAGGGIIGKHGQYYRDSWGTSISAALTSGAVALIRSRNPKMSARTVVQRLIATARPLGGSRWNNQTGYGAIQITAAMDPERYPVPAHAPNPVYDALDKWEKAQADAVKPVPVTPSQRAAHAAKERSHTLPIVLGVGGFLLIAALLAVGFVWRRRSRSTSSVVPRTPADPFGHH